MYVIVLKVIAKEVTGGTNAFVFILNTSSKILAFCSSVN